MLTAQEQAELDSLEQEKAQVSSGLSPDEAAELQALEREKAAQPGMAEAFGRGFTQGGSFGFADEAAGVGSALSELVSPTSEGGFGERLSKAYKSGREDERKEVAEAQQAHPYAFGAGGLTGGIISTLPLSAGAQTIKGAAALGAGTGALSGLGATEDITNLPQAAKDVAASAALGGVVAGGATAAGKVIAAPFKWAKARSQEAAKAAKVVASQTDEAVSDFQKAAEQMRKLSEEAREAAKKPPTLIPEEAVELPPMTRPKDFSPEPGPVAQRAAALKGEIKDPFSGQPVNQKQLAQDIEYFQKGKTRIMDPAAPSLDTQSPNAIGKTLPDDVAKFKTTLDDFEEATSELLSRNKVAVDKYDVAGLFEEEIQRLQKQPYSDSAAATIKQFQKYLDGDPNIGLPGLIPKDIEGNFVGYPGGNRKFSGDEMRAWLRNFRNDQRRMYVPGKDLTHEELAMKRMAARINSKLKGALEEANPTDHAQYQKLMKEYAERTEAFKTVQKVWKLDDNDIPQNPTWYDRYFVHPFQKVETGERFIDDSVTRALDKMGKVVGKDYPRMVKDQLVFGRLFPEQATGLQRGTWTMTTGRAASQLLRGQPGSAVGTVVKGALDTREAVKDALFKRMIMQEGERVPIGADLLEAGSRFASGVGKTVGAVGRGIEKGAELGTKLAAPLEPLARGIEITGRAAGVGEAAQLPQQEAVNHYLRMQRDPKYRAKYQGPGE